MPIDARIPLLARNPEIMSPNELAAESQALRQGQNMLMQQDNELKRRAEIPAIYAGAYKGGAMDYNALAEGLAGGGYGDKIPAALQAQAQQADLQRKAKSEEIDGYLEKLRIGSQLRAGVSDEASYQEAKANAAQIIGDVSHMPENYDPEWLEREERKSYTMAERLTLKKEGLDRDWDREKFAYGQEKDAAKTAYDKQKDDAKMAYDTQNANATRDVSMRGQDITMRGQDMNKARLDSIESAKQKLSYNSYDPKEMKSLIDQARPLLDEATGGYIGEKLDQLGRSVSYSTKGAKASARLKVIGGAMVARMPKPPGPASDRDIELAAEQVGRLGDQTVPAEEKKAAMEELIKITQRQVERLSAQANTGGATTSWGETQGGTPDQGENQNWSPDLESEYMQRYGQLTGGR